MGGHWVVTSQEKALHEALARVLGAGGSVALEPLDVFDAQYVDEDGTVRVGVERKTVPDMARSVVEGRWASQRERGVALGVPFLLALEGPGTLSVGARAAALRLALRTPYGACLRFSDTEDLARFLATYDGTPIRVRSENTRYTRYEVNPRGTPAVDTLPLMGSTDVWTRPPTLAAAFFDLQWAPPTTQVRDLPALFAERHDWTTRTAPPAIYEPSLTEPEVQAPKRLRRNRPRDGLVADLDPRRTLIRRLSECPGVSREAASRLVDHERWTSWADVQALARDTPTNAEDARAWSLLRGIDTYRDRVLRAMGVEPSGGSPWWMSTDAPPPRRDQ